MTELKQKTSNAFKSNAGFTLVEIIVVIVVAAFIAAIVTPNVVTKVANQRRKNLTEEAMQAVAAAEQLYSEHFTYSVAFNNSRIQSLAAVKGDVRYVEVQDDEVVHLCYVKGDEAVMYCRYYDELDTSGNHVKHFKVSCDAAGDVPAHSELYTVVPASALGMYVGDTDKIEVETIAKKSIEDFSFATTESTTESTTSSSGETTTNASDPSTEPTTKNLTNIHFDPNKDYSLGGDVSKRLLSDVVDGINEAISNNGWPNYTNPQTSAMPVYGYDNVKCWWPYEAEFVPGKDYESMKKLSSGSAYATYSLTDSNGQKHYYLIVQDRMNSITLLDGNKDTYSGSGVKQSMELFYDHNADGTVKETSIEKVMDNMTEYFNTNGGTNFVQTAIDNKFSSMSGSSSVYEYYLDDDHLVTKRFYSETGTKRVINAYGVERDLQNGDVYVDSILGNIEVYIDDAHKIDSGSGWYPIGSYTG